MARTEKQRLGERGETLAVRFFTDSGYRLLARNFRFGRGEIDLIVCKGDLLVFAEVKSFYRPPLDLPEYRVNRSKQRKLIETAHGFLLDHAQFADYRLRFDVLIVDFSRYPAALTHYPAAFWPEEAF